MNVTGEANDGPLLETLRKFRDNWLVSQPGGIEEIKTYYKLSKKAANGIYARGYPEDVLLMFYERFFGPCIEEIMSEREHRAQEHVRQFLSEMSRYHI